MNARGVATAGAVLIAAGLTVAVAPAGAQEKAGAVPSFAGRWRLNRELSDKPPATDVVGTKDQAKAEKGQDVKPGKGKRSAPPAPAAATTEASPGQTAAQTATQQPPEVTVRQSEIEVVAESKASDGKPESRSFYPNGKTYKADEGSSTIRSYWKNGTLVFEKKNARGWRYTETWQVTPDGKQLRVDTHLEGGGQKTVNAKRVYDRLADEQK